MLHISPIYLASWLRNVHSRKNNLKSICAILNRPLQTSLNIWGKPESTSFSCLLPSSPPRSWEQRSPLTDCWHLEQNLEIRRCNAPFWCQIGWKWTIINLIGYTGWLFQHCYKLELDSRLGLSLGIFACRPLVLLTEEYARELVASLASQTLQYLSTTSTGSHKKNYANKILLQ